MKTAKLPFFLIKRKYREVDLPVIGSLSESIPVD